MDIYNQIIQKIVREQQLIIGPLAQEEAKKVPGISWGTTGIEIATQNKQETIDALIARYERIFGKASHEVCRKAVRSLISQLSMSDIPLSLR